MRYTTTPLTTTSLLFLVGAALILVSPQAMASSVAEDGITAGPITNVRGCKLGDRRASDACRKCVGNSRPHAYHPRAKDTKCKPVRSDARSA